MSSSEWSILAAYTIVGGESHPCPYDLELYALESELNSQGIRVLFLPYRPGENGAYEWQRGATVRLLVPTSEVERARMIAKSAGIDDLLAEA